jgi:hypothetical protein
MRLENFTTNYIQQMNNPECSLLAGQTMGMFRLSENFFLFVLIGVFISISTKSIIWSSKKIYNKIKSKW